MRKNKLNTSQHLADPLIVATSCSWRRIIGGSGRPVCIPTNHHIDNHPDLEATNEDLTLFSASPELYESNIILLEALQRTLKGEDVSNMTDVIEFAEKALDKAEKPHF